MFLLLILFGLSNQSLLQNTNQLYEDLRDTTQSFILQLPQQLIKTALGIQNKDQDVNEEFYINKEQSYTKLHTKPNFENITLQDQNRQIRQLQENTQSVNEYYRQGPLEPIYCAKGQNLLLNVTYHYCFGEKVTYAQYKSYMAEDETSCTLRFRLKYGCLCPPDFYGEQCLWWNQIWCEMEQQNTNCQGVKEDNYYNYNIDGNPPCEEIDSSDLLQESVRTVCYNRNQEILNSSIFTVEENYTVIWSNYSRGISALMLRNYKYNAPNPQDPNDPQQYIQYAATEDAEKSVFFYDQNDLFLDTITLRSSLEFNIQPYVKYVDWKAISNSSVNTFDQNLTLTELIGSEYFKVQINPNLSVSQYGRYSFEIGLILYYYGYSELYYPTNSTSTQTSKAWYLPHISPKSVFYEDLSYQEPLLNDDEMKRIAKIIAIVLIIILVIMLLCFLYKKDAICEVITGAFRPERVYPQPQDQQSGFCQKLRKLFQRSQVQQQ